MYRDIYDVDIWDAALAKILRKNGVVKYITKKLKDHVTSRGIDELWKEMTVFTMDHSGIVRPVAVLYEYQNPILIFPYWNGKDIKKWMKAENDTRGKLSFNKKLRIRVPNDIIDKYTREELALVVIFCKHHLEIVSTLWSTLAFTHQHKWLHCDIHLRNLFIHFSRWDYEKGSFEQRKNSFSPFLMFVGIGDLKYAQRMEIAAGCKDENIQSKRRIHFQGLH